MVHIKASIRTVFKAQFKINIGMADRSSGLKQQEAYFSTMRDVEYKYGICQK